MQNHLSKITNLHLDNKKAGFNYWGARLSFWMVRIVNKSKVATTERLFLKQFYHIALNNSSKKELLCHAGPILGQTRLIVQTSLWVNVLMLCSNSMPPTAISDSMSFLTYRNTYPLWNKHPRFSWIFEWIAASEIDFTFLLFLNYLALSIGTLNDIPDRLRIEHNETRTKQMKTIHSGQKRKHLFVFPRMITGSNHMAVNNDSVCVMRTDKQLPLFV